MPPVDEMWDVFERRVSGARQARGREWVPVTILAQD